MDSEPTTSASIRSPRLAFALFAALFALGACGSSDDSGPADPAGDTNLSPEATAPLQPSGGGEGGTATLTMADGTTYDFALNTCVTSDMEQQGFAAGAGYDVFGRTADEAFTLYLGRAWLSETDSTQSGSLEGDFDENGKNAGILYSASSDSMKALTVDGKSISGDLAFRAIGPGPHGAQTTATVEVSC